MRAAWQRLTAAASTRSPTGASSSRPSSSRALIPALSLAYRALSASLARTQPGSRSASIRSRRSCTRPGRTRSTILLVTLSVTPIRRLFRSIACRRVRRMLGVWAFAYALLHLSIYLVFDQLCYSSATCEFDAIWQDILKRRFIFVGMLAFVDPAAARDHVDERAGCGGSRRTGSGCTGSSTSRRVAGVVHFIWIQKSDISEPLRWAFWLLVLLRDPRRTSRCRSAARTVRRP